MQSELKPCPFCGGDAEYHSDKGPTGEVYAWVGCNQCDAMSVHCDVRSMQPEETHPIDAWNTRASDAERREPDANENPYSRARLNSENTKLRAEITRLTEALCAAEDQVKGLRDKFLNVADDAGETYLGWVEKGCDPADAIRVIGWIEDFARRALKGPSHDK